MSPQLARLALRQQALLQRSAQLRHDLGVHAAALQPPLAWAERVRDGWRWLRAHPEVPLAAGVALVVLRPRRAWRWGRRLWAGWRLWRTLQRRLQRL